MAKTNIKYSHVEDWMIADLSLTTKNELLIYAIIYGYSNIEGQWYTANQQSLADFLKTDRPAVNRTLKKLYQKGLVIAEEVSRVGSAVTYKYKAIVPNGCQNDNGTTNGCQNDNGNGCQNDNGNGCQNDTQYKYNNKYIYNNNNSLDTPPTDEVDGQAQFDTTEEFDNYIDSYQESRPLLVQIKRKIMDMTSLSSVDVSKICQTAVSKSMSDTELIELCQYAMNQDCKNLTAYILGLIENGFSKPQKGYKKTGFNNFEGRKYDYDKLESLFLTTNE